MSILHQADPRDPSTKFDFVAKNIEVYHDAEVNKHFESVEDSADSVLDNLEIVQQAYDSNDVSVEHINYLHNLDVMGMDRAISLRPLSSGYSTEAMDPKILAAIGGVALAALIGLLGKHFGWWAAIRDKMGSKTAEDHADEIKQVEKHAKSACESVKKADADVVKSEDAAPTKAVQAIVDAIVTDKNCYMADVALIDKKIKVENAGIMVRDATTDLKGIEENLKLLIRPLDDLIEAAKNPDSDQRIRNLKASIDELHRKLNEGKNSLVDPSCLKPLLESVIEAGKLPEASGEGDVREIIVERGQAVREMITASKQPYYNTFSVDDYEKASIVSHDVQLKFDQYVKAGKAVAETAPALLEKIKGKQEALNKVAAGLEGKEGNEAFLELAKNFKTIVSEFGPAVSMINSVYGYGAWLNERVRIIEKRTTAAVVIKEELPAETVNNFVQRALAKLKGK